MPEYLMDTYARLPVAFERGEGIWLFDEQGRRYLDAVGGIAVCGLGHAHPGVARAIAAQAETLLHTSNLFRIKNQEKLAERLCRVAGMDRAFFSNSGAEANEAAFKLARLHGHGKGFETPEIIVADGSFHGRTLATLSATGNRKIQAGFEPLVSGFLRVAYNDPAAIKTLAGRKNQVAAVFVEPVQGEGGVVMPDADYLHELRSMCDLNGWLLMLDEVQTGMGRTGKWFAYQHSDCRPDVVTSAKALGNGVPIGACLARGSAAELFSPGHHGSTFGGNPLACAAAIAVIDTIEEGDLLDNATVMGERLMRGLKDVLAGANHVCDIRGKGLMVGIELDYGCADLVGKALQEGLLINVTAKNTIRLLPPLTVKSEEIDEIVAKVGELVRANT